MSFKSLLKKITNTSALTSLGISSLISLMPEIKAENFDQLKQIAKSKNVDFEKIGVINREIIRINNSNEIKISELKKNFEQGVENI